MGLVYLAEHIETGQRVALKTVKVSRQALLSSIRREAQALSRLRHPGIVRILDEGVGHAGSLHQGVPWYAMELLSGQSLRRWMSAPQEPKADLAASLASRGGTSVLESEESSAVSLLDGRELRGVARSLSPIDLEDALTICRRLCAALAFLHGEGILHRDLKPENIFLAPPLLSSGEGVGGRGPRVAPQSSKNSELHPVLVDFGLASLSGADSRALLDVEARRAGTAYYMSPEQIRGEVLDARSDLYSLGVILYELTTCQRPFRGATHKEVLRAHLEETPRPPSELSPSIPKDLEGLILALLSKDRRERPGYAEDVARSLGEEASERARPYLYHPGFSGRRALLSTLMGLLSPRSGGVILLSGESGVGKTRLVSELCREAARGGWLILSGECEDTAARRPLSAFRRPLSRMGDLCRERGRAFTERVFGPRAQLLGRYEPTLQGLFGQQSEGSLSAEEARRRLLVYLGESLYAFGDAAREGEGGLLVVLDDLQWADELTLAFLALFLESGLSSQGGLVFLGTYRSEEAPEALRKLFTHSDVKQLSVDRLEESEVAEMVGEMLALRPPPNIFSRFLTEQSEGNPFFVAEYLRAAVEEGLLWRDNKGRWTLKEGALESPLALSLPRSLRALVLRRLAGLSLEAREQLWAAAILGRELPLSLLSRLGSWEGVEDELIKKQLLFEPQPMTLRFVHDKLREVALSQIEPEKRPSLHRSAAMAIEALSLEEERLGALGYHWQEAGEPALARRYYLSGARKAAEQFGHEESERLYRAYLALSVEPSKERALAHSELAEELQIRGQLALGALEGEKALSEARGIGDPGVEAACLRRLGVIYQMTGRVEESEEFVLLALSLARKAKEQHLEGICLRAIATVRWRQGRLLEAQAPFEQALSLHRELGEHVQQGICLNNLGILHWAQGKLPEAQAAFEKAMLIHRLTHNTEDEGITLVNLALLRYSEGQVEEASVLGEQAVALLHKVGNRPHEASARANLGYFYGQLGRMEEGRGLLLDALATMRQWKDQRGEGLYLGALAELERRRGAEPESVEALLSQGESLLIAASANFDLARLLCISGHLALAKGQSARVLLARAKALEAEVGSQQESDLGQRLSRLEAAQRALEEGQAQLLFRGELLRDIPPPVRKWLIETGQLPKDKENVYL